jgi:hypothetical protein
MSKNHKHSHWFVLIVATILSLVIFSPIQAHDSGEAMLKVLAASGPNPSLGDEAKVFDRFIGTWDCNYTFHSTDGKITHDSGELLFGWVLDGLAMQDIWITYPKKAGQRRDIGTSVRFFDNKTKTWQVVFVNPVQGAITVRGGTEGDRIILRGNARDGSQIRWSFNDIKPNSFVWRGEKSGDGGKTWVLQEEHHMKRREENKIGGAK